MAMSPSKEEYAQSTARGLTGTWTIAILCLSGAVFCIAGIGYAGMPPVHGLRWAYTYVLAAARTSGCSSLS